MKAARTTRDAPLPAASHVPAGDGVVRAAGGFQVSLSDDPVVAIIDSDDSLIYQPDVCDCGNDRFRNNRCTACGSVAPWATKLGCGLL